MVRQMFQTQEHLNNEAEIADAVGQAWKCEWSKNPCPPYKIDVSFKRGKKVMAMAEIKQSYSEDYPHYICALHKFRDMVENSALIKTYLIVRKSSGGIIYMDMFFAKPVGFHWMQDKRQRDYTDNEPAVFLSWNDFKQIGDK